MNKTPWFIALIALAIGLAPASAEIPVKLTPILTDHEFTRPISLITSPDDSKRQFMVEQRGQIKIIKAGGGAPEVFLDFSGRKMEGIKPADFEEGLLGLAFHPKFAENGKFYVCYSQQGPKRTVISEIQVSKDNPDVADLKTERILLQIQQPAWNHNGGGIFFGPKDGFLYICVGDGGERNGIHLLAQKLTSWSGKVLRIDVDSKSAGREYGIPADNPFAKEPIDACPEIFAYGIRNPWGASIDPETGVFWLADVGQNLWEEVNFIVSGGNYGWNYREGFHVHLGLAPYMEAIGTAKKADPPKGVEMIDPAWEYNRGEGLSITGGFVYHGEKIPALKGHFIVGDWKLGNLWAVKKTGENKAEGVELLRPTPEDKIQPTGFYPDLNGEPVLLNWDGRIFRIEAK